MWPGIPVGLTAISHSKSVKSMSISFLFPTRYDNTQFRSRWKWAGFVLRLSGSSSFSAASQSVRLHMKVVFLRFYDMYFPDSVSTTFLCFCSWKWAGSVLRPCGTSLSVSQRAALWGSGLLSGPEESVRASSVQSGGSPAGPHNTAQHLLHLLHLLLPVQFRPQKPMAVFILLGALHILRNHG